MRETYLEKEKERKEAFISQIFFFKVKDYNTLTVIEFPSSVTFLKMRKFLFTEKCQVINTEAIIELGKLF